MLAFDQASLQIEGMKTLEKQILELLTEHNLTCYELIDAADAEESEIALAVWNLVRAGKVKFAFDHWEAI